MIYCVLGSIVIMLWVYRPRSEASKCLVSAESCKSENSSYILSYCFLSSFFDYYDVIHLFLLIVFNNMLILILLVERNV